MLTTTAAGRVFNYSHYVGMYSTGDAGFGTPVDLALGAGGVMYVLSRGVDALGGQRVSKCTTNHEFLGEFGGGYGKGDGQTIWPRSVALDHDENVYIGDENLHRISIFDNKGKFLNKWGELGSGDGELNGPSGIAFDQDDNIYIVDSLNSRVQKFTRDGKFLAKWGQRGSGDGEFDMPWGICIDGNGDVYVADWKNRRVQKFSPDGKFLAEFSASESGVGAVNSPTGVAVDNEGDVYVTDWANDQVQVYAPDGSFIASLVGDAQQTSPWTQAYIDANPDIIKARRMVNLEVEWRFRRPVTVKVDAENRIFVADSGRHRIQIYDKVKQFEEPSLNL